MKKAWLPVFSLPPINLDSYSKRVAAISGRGLYSNRGPEVIELEERVGALLNLDAKRVVVTSKATVALVVALALAGERKWSSGAWSFPATALAALAAQKDLKLVDLDPSSWLPNLAGTPQEFGRLATLPFGANLDFSVFDMGVTTVIDAAASLMAGPYDFSNLPGNFSVVFSLHATKILGGGEGGVLVCGSTEQAGRARTFINFGFSGSRDSIVLGTNGKMSEFDAAACNVRFDDWPSLEPSYLELKASLNQLCSDFGLSDLPQSMKGLSPYQIAFFRSNEERDVAERRFAAAGIETRRWWGDGLHKMPAFESIASGRYPGVDELAGRSLGLPFHLGISEFGLAQIRLALSDVIK